MENERQKLSLQRFKGLGEIDPEELWKTTLNPDNRIFYKFNTLMELKINQKKIKKLLASLWVMKLHPEENLSLATLWM